MKKINLEGIQPEIIRWARETIGLSISDVAKTLKKPLEEIEAWESGEKAPSYSQLELLAYTVFKRPLAVFFLPKPPIEKSPEQEFRTLPKTDLRTLEKDTFLQIRKGHAFQIALREIFLGSNPSEKLVWKDISATLDSSVDHLAESIRSYLSISLSDQQTWINDDTALKKWRIAIENVGVFVFKSPFKQKSISGFCLKDPLFPLIVVNNGSSKTRQIFSLIHELVHLILDINGLSKFENFIASRSDGESEKIEKFCNAVAAEFLIPSRDFNKFTQAFGNSIENISESDFSSIAFRYKVSREAVLRRFLDQKRISIQFYENKAKEWSAQKKSASGGDYYASQNVYLSKIFLEKVIGLHYENHIDINKAADYLGIKPKSFVELESRVLQRTNG